MTCNKIEQAQTVFRLVSHLLQYPDQAWRESLARVRQVVDTLHHTELKAFLERFLQSATQTVSDAALHEVYVQTFDFGKMTNLYVTYARHGEQRERGPALLALKQFYAKNGWQVTEDELPDYLPLMLEFASVAPLDAVRELFSEHRLAIRDIGEQLRERDSLYTDLFDAISLAMDEMNIPLAEEGGVVS